jgi:hypothetical protein
VTKNHKINPIEKVKVQGKGFEPLALVPQYGFLSQSNIPTEDYGPNLQGPQKEWLDHSMATCESRQITRLSPYNTATSEGHKVGIYKNPVIISLEISPRIFENFSSLFSFCNASIEKGTLILS